MDSQIVSLPEFGMPSNDWMSVGVCSETHTKLGKALGPPGKVLEMSRASDRMRDEAVRPGSVHFDEWAAFAFRVEQRFAELGIFASAGVGFHTAGDLHSSAH